MAIFKSLKEIEHLIPSPNEHFYMGILKQVPEEIIQKKPIYAIVIDNKTKRVINVYQAVFVLFSTSIKHYLYIGDVSKELTASTKYISTAAKDGQKDVKPSWDFKVDDIGLHVNTEDIDKSIIYFTNSYIDVSEIRKKLNENNYAYTEANTTVRAATVYL